MKGILFIFVCVLRGYQCAEPTCGDNEIVEDCPVACSSDYCPKSAADNQSCPKPNECGPAECKCRFNYRRADNETCIPTRDCPPFACSNHEIYNPCPAYCPTDSCADRKLNGVCPFNVLILLICQPRCVCADGYYRNPSSGHCVTADQCPDDQQPSNPSTTGNGGGSSQSSQTTASASASGSGDRSTATASAAAVSSGGASASATASN